MEKLKHSSLDIQVCYTCDCGWQHWLGPAQYNHQHFIIACDCGQTYKPIPPTLNAETKQYKPSPANNFNPNPNPNFNLNLDLDLKPVPAPKLRQRTKSIDSNENLIKSIEILQSQGFDQSKLLEATRKISNKKQDINKLVSELIQSYPS